MLERRSCLSGLAGLPLIGGSVALIGQPTAAAMPITDELRWAYKDWLKFEHRMACFELAGHDVEQCRVIERQSAPGACEWHFQWSGRGGRGPAGWIDAPQPSTRAAIVLSAVGCPLTAEV